MTAATPRIANQTSDGRRLGVAMVMIIVAVALLVAVAIAQQASKSSAASATGKTHELIVGNIRYTGIPYPARDPRTLPVGGVKYIPIPYGLPAANTPVVNAQTGFVTSGAAAVAKPVSPTSDDSPSFNAAQRDYSSGGAPYPVPGVVANPVVPAIDDSTFFKNGISNPAPVSNPYYTGGINYSGVANPAVDANQGTTSTPRQIGTR